MIEQFKVKVKNYRQENSYLQDLKNQSEFINNNMSQFQAKAMRDYESLQNNYDKLDNDLELFDKKIDTYESSVDTSRPLNNPVQKKEKWEDSDSDDPWDEGNPGEIEK